MVHQSKKRKLKQKIVEWLEAKEQLAEWKETESILRDELTEKLFPQAEEGSNTIELPFGIAKCIQKYNVKIDESSLKEATKELTPKLKRTIMKVSRTLNKKVYAELTPKQKACFDECLTHTPAKPTLQIDLFDE